MSQTKAEPSKTKYGKWAIITDASSGIGRALANELAAIVKTMELSRLLPNLKSNEKWSWI